MIFNLSKSIEILERTPKVLKLLLEGLDEEWILNNEGGESWSPYDIIGHLVYLEKTDWIVRTEIILSDDTEKTFAPFDQFAQFEASKGKTISALLKEFQALREANLTTLKSKKIGSDDLKKTGIHQVLGEVTLENLLACWVAHDLGHLAQISRVIAKQHKEEVGPWLEYLPILSK